MTSKIKVNIFADGGDNSIITSDGAGSFTASSGLATSVASVGSLANTPFFEARRSGAHSFSAGTATKVPFNVAFIDTDSAFNTSNNRFTVPSGKGGKYFFNASVFQEVPSNDDRVFCYFYKNGSNVYNTGLWGKTSKCTALASVYLDLSVGDYIEVYTNTEGAGTVNIDPSDIYTRFFGMRIIGA